MILGGSGDFWSCILSIWSFGTMFGVRCCYVTELDLVTGGWFDLLIDELLLLRRRCDLLLCLMDYEI